MSGAQRRKGREGENEARKVFTGANVVIAPLQAGRTGRADAGDFTVTYSDVYLDNGLSPLTLVCDAKRREKVRVQEWARGIEAIARPGEVPVTVWRSNGEPWRVTLLAEDFARLVAR